MAQTRKTRSTGASKKAAAAKKPSSSRPKKTTRQESGAAAAQAKAELEESKRGLDAFAEKHYYVEKNQAPPKRRGSRDLFTPERMMMGCR